MAKQKSSGRTVGTPALVAVTGATLAAIARPEQ